MRGRHRRAVAAPFEDRFVRGDCAALCLAFICALLLHPHLCTSFLLEGGQPSLACDPYRHPHLTFFFLSSAASGRLARDWKDDW